MKEESNIVNILREFSIALISGIVVALIWVNLLPDSYHSFLHNEVIPGFSFYFFVNEIFMVFFFAMAAVEITQSLLPGGVLNPLKKALNPLFATLGGVLGPICVFLILNALIGSSELTRGWGIPTATDIALAWLVAKIVFGSGHPAISFLLLLAIVDDGIGLAIITIFYPDPGHTVNIIWLILVMAGMLAAFTMRKFRVRSYWPYLLGSGTLSWLGLFFAHLHPALALVFIIPFLPHPVRETHLLFEEDFDDHSTLGQFEQDWKVFVDFGLFIFGLANAGVEFTDIATVTWIVFLALLIGKTVGIFLFSWIAGLIGFSLPLGMGKKELFVASSIAAMGLTVALFVAGVAYTDESLRGAAKMGALFSGIIAIFSLISGKMLKIQKLPTVFDNKFNQNNNG